MPSLPTTRLSRAARLARTGLRTTAALASGGEAWAESLADGLGELRGLATKVGQMASYMEGMVPADPRAMAAMARLRAGAATSEPAAVRAVVEEELGAPVGELFATWEDTPLASASLGQVHAATLADGREVVVKVQHPGVADAVASDLAQAHAVAATVGAMARGMPVEAILAEVEARLAEELDYRAEARFQAAYASAFAGDAEVAVPEVIADRSAGRVLTATRGYGASVDEATGADEALRKAWVRSTWRAFVEGALRTGLLHGDPHPGNLLLQPDGGLVLLDYGCVQPLDDGEREQLVRLLAACTTGGEADVHAALVAIAGPGPMVDALVPVWRECLPAAGRPTRVDRARAQRIGQAMMYAKRPSVAFRGGARGFPPWFALAHRTFLGLASAVAPLDVAVDLGGLTALALRAQVGRR